MNVQNLLLNQLPDEIKEKVIKEDIELFGYFMFNDIKKVDYAFIISTYANHKNTVNLHEMAACIFHFHFNYYEYAYEYAFYHYWKALELTEFKNKEFLEDLLLISEEPDFDIIPNEYLEFVKEKLKSL
ncbi:hypothetical protein [Macrococcus sp. DPC7161]|uniref:hypothetical protein n=1 Tax=Macrococcus sp. DPC7161 TaxID=2507060 RepID=UPI00100BD1B3|nr:hypothetical protein [Macrococcus sp. DPC7161]RXK18997.1 hypothetical protein ER639_01420 [Macrococcus sp. DPC7161]